jgi:Outer membrane protein beta-barrel domain
MKRFSSFPAACWAIATRLLLCSLAIFVCLPAFAQEDVSINRYTLYTGFDYFAGPKLSMVQRGFDTDFGITVKPWLGLGVDFSASGDSIISGGGTINGTSTVYAPILNDTYNNGIPGVLPPHAVPSANGVNVSFKSTTYTVAVGGQFYIRKLRKVTFLVRPGFGAIHAPVDLNVPPTLPPLFELLQLPPVKSQQTDTNWFIGFGGGFDINLTRRVGMRFTADWINTHLFSNILTDRQNYIRFTVGPTWKWGTL